MLKQLLQPEINDMIQSRNYSDIKNIINLWPAIETSELVSSVNIKDKLILFRLLNKDYAASVFSEMKIREQKELINAMKENEIAILLQEMEPDDRTSLFEELPASVTKRIFKLLKGDDLDVALKLLGYPKDSIGRLMTLEYMEINITQSLKDAINIIKNKGYDSEVFDIAYVVDDNEKLLGFISIKTLFFSDMNKNIIDIMNKNIISVSAYEDQEKAIYLIKEYDFIALPVVDSENVLLGIVTVDDIMDIAEEEYTEDIHKMVGLSGSSVNLYEDIKSTSIFNLYIKRIPWLLILIFMNMFSAAIIGFYENTIVKYITLIFFMPLLISSGGNAGGQSATLIIRSLAIKDINSNDWFTMFLKECFVSFLLGATMAIAVSSIGFLRGGVIISFVVGISMISIVLIGSLIGVSLPFIFSKMHIDPASGSVALVTSICDIVGISLYLGLATVLLNI